MKPLPPCRLSLLALAVQCLAVQALHAQTVPATADAPASDAAVATLQEVVVSDTNPFAALTNNKVGGQADLKVLGKRSTFDAPVNAVSYSENMIEDQQARTTTDLLGKNDPAVTVMGGEGYILHGIQVRGMRVDTREFGLNGLSGLFAGFQSSTAYIGSIDVIKGASNGLGGISPESAVGASVNVRTKTAGKKDLTRVGLGWFADSRWQGSVDASRRFGENREWGARLNAQYRRGETARDFQKEKNGSFAFNADYKGQGLRAQLDVIHNNRHFNASRIRIDGIHSLAFALPAAPDGSHNMAQPWTWQKGKETIVALTGEADLAKGVTLSAGVGRNKTDSPQMYQSLTLRDAAGNFREGNVSIIRRTIETASANLGLRGYHAWGGVSHDWAITLDYTDRDRGTSRSASNTYASAGRANNIYNTTYWPAPTVTGSYGGMGYNTNTSTSLGFADTLGFFDDSLRLTLGARHQQLKQHSTSASGAVSNRYSDGVINPMVALAWQPQANLVVYGNYLRDLEPGGIVDDDTALNNNELLPPTKANQIEVGVRKNWGNVTTAAALYQIEKPTIYLNSQTRLYGVNGHTRFRGLEANAYGSFLNGRLRPGFGFTVMRAELRSQDKAELNGNQSVGTPRFVAKANLEWDMPWAPGLTVKAGAQHYGSVYQDPANRWSLGGYTLLDAGLRYTTKLAGREASLNLGIENLGNKRYWQTFIGGGTGSGTRSIALLGMPRTVWLSIRMDL